MKKLIIIIFISVFSSFVYAAGSDGGDKKESKDTASDGVKAATKYDTGKKLISKAKKLEKKSKDAKAKKTYEKAIKYLLEANSQNSVDPDILNLLGFSHRKIGDFENAEIYYSMGLALDPKHVGINEYMGELFVVTNRLDKAKERLAVLKDCNCKEYKELKLVIEGKKESKY